MAIIANTALTHAGQPGILGLREDLSDIIYNISPQDTPFMSNVGRGTCDAVYHEWQTDTLAAADTANAQYQGDDIASFAAASVTSRIGNRTQISRKTLIVSGTLDAVNKAGRKTELAYQMTKRGKELKIDIEAILLSNQAQAVGAVATAPKVGSVLSFINTNTNHVGTDPVGNGTNVRVDGTARAFTEAMLKDVLSQLYTNSSEEPDVLMVGAWLKGVVSTFTGGSTKFLDSADKKVVAAIDVYVGDFHTIRVVPNRFMRTRDALVLDYSYWSVDWLRPIRQETLAKTGDAEKRMLH